MADLAERVLLTRSGLTGLVKRLEAAGLVERAPAQEDARGAFAVLTPLGIQRLRAAHRTHLASIRGRFTGQLSEAELAQLGALWRRLA
jgi:DNA-binding MarR family transcriptional regulator